jgi:hypothetical protein
MRWFNDVGKDAAYASNFAAKQQQQTGAYA